MRHIARFFAWVVGVTVSGSPAALAQEGEPERGTTSPEGGYVINASADPRSHSEDWLILPEGGATVGGHLRFLTAEGGLGEEALRFTDVVLLDMNGRLSLGGTGELFASTTLLPKQPSRTGELLWQGTSLGGRVGFVERFAASARASVGPALAHSGYWATADVGLEARKSLHDTLRVQGLLGGSATALFLEGSPERRLGFGEVVVGGEVVLRVPNGAAAVWLGTQFHFPVVRSAWPASARADLEPQTRVSFRVGGVLSYIEDWDLFAELIVNDRGELREPPTRLPLLDGGFDQTLLLLGVTRRFQRDSR
ncbi:hypothetical protein [Archangium sp.]|uniref:hypothetical protein n=1 Tax=Archangium sp. TaxID=1872627 RepID=UPI002D268811|nr:hypothetical protein [Archangium sp.]HYO56021.1 hypothetical protein [Archangium sp.]